MTITSQELSGVMAMMPAFATDDAGDIRAKETVHVENLKEGVDNMIRDGAHIIATMGSFGECSTMLMNEFKTLTTVTVEAVNKRVPLFIGCTSPNAREAVEKLEFIRDCGADGALVGVPYYFPLSVENAIQFYHDIADLFPSLGFIAYHNPPLHRVRIPVEAMRKMVEKPNIVAMKDSHRTPIEFMQEIDITRGKMSIFVEQRQLHPYYEWGAAGCWSIDAWMGPWPVLRLWNAVREHDEETAKEIIYGMSSTRSTGPADDMIWRETGHKIAQNMAGYCKPGPLRPPYTHVPDWVMEFQKRRSDRWNELCAKYRPEVERARSAGVPVGATGPSHIAMGEVR